MSLAVLIEALLVENGLKSEVIYKDDPYAADRPYGQAATEVDSVDHGTLPLPQFLNRIAFEMKNPTLSEQPDLEVVIRDLLLCMRRDEVFQEGDAVGLGQQQGSVGCRL